MCCHILALAHCRLWVSLVELINGVPNEYMHDKSEICSRSGTAVVPVNVQTGHNSAQLFSSGLFRHLHARFMFQKPCVFVVRGPP